MENLPPFPIMFEEWDLGTACEDIAAAWDNHGDIVVGNDVWIGYEAVILAGVTIGDGAIIGSRAGCAALYHRGRSAGQDHPQAV